MIKYGPIGVEVVAVICSLFIAINPILFVDLLRKLDMRGPGYESPKITKAWVIFFRIAGSVVFVGTLLDVLNKLTSSP